MAAAGEAAALVRAGFGRLGEGDVSRKGANDLVTVVDRESEALLRDRLAGDGQGFLGEETGHSGSDKVLWVVDPLDGTRNFVHGIPVFAVSIALVAGGEPVVGVVADVMGGEVFLAAAGTGAWVEREGERRALSVSARPTLAGALAATGFPHQQRGRLDPFLRQLGALFTEVGGVRRMGAAALDLAHTAAGRYELFWEGGLSAWDIAAGILLVREAGGEVTDWAGGGVDIFGPGDLLATNRRVHERALCLVRAALG